MIIFDTSVLYGLNRNSPNFDLLMALKHSGSQPAGIPWMVREELVAQQVLEYESAHDEAEVAIAGLNRKTPWARAATLPSRDVENAKKYWRGQYEEVLNILETSSDSAKTALEREAYCQKPAKPNPGSKGSKGGARDVAIWLSVIDYLKENPTEKVVFVSNNVRDFSDGTNYPSPMSEDLGDMGPRLSLLTSFDEFISAFTERIEADSNRVKELLAYLVGDSLTPIGHSANSMLRGGRFEGTRIDSGTFAAFQWRLWILPPSAVVRNVSNASGHKIADAEWYTSTVDWILVGLTQPVLLSMYQRDVSAIVQTACEWRTKVLFNIGEDRKLTIVNFQAPKALDPSERADWQPLIDNAIAATAQSSTIFGAYASSLMQGDDAPPLSSPNIDVIFGNVDQD